MCIVLSQRYVLCDVGNLPSLTPHYTHIHIHIHNRNQPYLARQSALSQKMNKSRSLLFTITIYLNRTTAFSIFSSPKLIGNPAIQSFSESSTGSKLDIRIDVTGNTDSSKMTISGLKLELHNVQPSYTHPNLPGVHGPHPELSTGAKALHVLQDGSFVSMQGTQYVPLVHGCWELVWKHGALAGSLVCAFDLEHDATRNDCTLPKGRIYLSFPVWEKVGLLHAQLVKKDIQSRANVYLADKQAELQKCLDDPNPLMKALYYRNAAVAMNKYQDSGVLQYKFVPEMNEVVEWDKNNKLYVTTKGLVWTKDGSFLRGDHALLGTATLTKQQAP